MDEREKDTGIFEDDDLDEAVTAADDTGMVATEQEIAEEEILSHLQEEPDETPD